MVDAKRDMMAFLSSCAEDIGEAVLVIRTINGIAIASTMNMQEAQVLMKEGSEWITSRGKIPIIPDDDNPAS